MTAQAGAFADITAPARAAAVASETGRVVKLGSSAALGRYIELRDAYGTTYTYSGLGSFARWYPAPQSASTEAGLTAGERRGARGRVRISGSTPTQSAVLAKALRTMPRVGPSLRS